jgi:hypothetical protein
MYQDFEEDVCAWCGAPLPENPPIGSWEMEGCCDAKCALYQSLSDLGVAAGMEPRKGITAEYRDQILRAVAELAK